MKKVVYVTGCLGFIGSYVTRECLKKGWQVRGVDKITYAANKDLLKEFNSYDNFVFTKCDINDLEFIYGWNPLRIYLLDPFRLIKSIKTPEVFSEFRGSTSVVKMNDLNYVVTHSVVSSKYLHHLIALDNYGNPIFYSKPFSFEGEAIEYCLSFSILNNDIIQFHYSLWDGCSKSMDVHIDFFMDNKLDLY